MNFIELEKILTDEMFYGSMPHWQAEPVERIVREGLRRRRSVHDCAYVLATGYHETARWKYTHEIGEGRGRDYGEPLLIIRGQTVAYYGRSDVQLTWLRNYAKMSLALTLEFGRPIDLVNNPEQATTPEISSYIIWQGMIAGMFTGKNLADYVRGDTIDYVSARKIVNGTDKDELVAGYALKFERALQHSGYSEDGVPERGLLAGLLGKFGG